MPNLMNDIDMSYVETESPFCQINLAAIAALGSLAETAFGLVGPGPLALDLGAVQFHPSAAITANNTNYFTITVNKRTAASPGTAVPIAIMSLQLFGTGSGVGNLAAWSAANFFIQTGAGSFISPGDALTISVASTGGSGLAMPQSWVGLFLKGR